ncbi:MAG TPA: TonB family protein [Candidatus Aquilonibacter sp.]|nr:TonB family protein [Candidatus Aquilonibacter sp.]
MPLRCLLFSSDQSLAAPIWQALADLGIEGEYCGNAVEAVERVTTQLFQIVITDWDDQPEAEFLLKTARELKAAHRPLTLAMVQEDSHLPLALRAGANSILRKPLSPDQVRDTLSTARDLLRSKMEPSNAGRPPASATPLASVSGPAAAPALAPITAANPARNQGPAAVTTGPESAFRAGEFLQPASSDPGQQFDTGTESEAAKAAVQAAAAEVDPLNELEPMAAAVEANREKAETAEAQADDPEQMTGWSAVKARLAKLGPPAATAPSGKPELLSYADSASQSTPAASTPEPAPQKVEVEKLPAESKAEAQLFAYIAGESPEEPEPKVANAPNHLLRWVIAGSLAAGAVAVVKIPAAHQGAVKLYAAAVHAGNKWLNPPVAAPPQAPAQHETFGQADDEYKLPAVPSIPDATTDPSQIRVLPVVDPTAKPKKDAADNSGQDQTPSTSADSVSGASSSSAPQVIEPAGPTAATTSQAGSSTVGGSSGNSSGPISGTPGSAIPSQPTLQTTPPAPVANPAPISAPSPVQNTPARQPVSGASNAIPPSLRSQMASTVPQASGIKPAETALPSLEPVSLPESVARSLLVQQVSPVYPETAKNLQGSVSLQVLIAPDGSVQDAKFLQGSLAFAQSAIDAVRKWHFKPYVLNGRPTSAQTVITLHFTPSGS